MREYESIFVLEPDVDDAQVDVEVDRIREVILGGQGEVTEVQKWGRRKLAYEINKKREGIYTLVRFKGGPNVLQELNRRYRLNESLLRHLTVLYETPPPTPEGETAPGDSGEESGREGFSGGQGRFGGRPFRRYEDDDERPRHRGRDKE